MQRKLLIDLAPNFCEVVCVHRQDLSWRTEGPEGVLVLGNVGEIVAFSERG